MATLTIIRGTPGSGKSTYAKQHFNCLILENDMLHQIDGEYKWSARVMNFATQFVYDTTKAVLKNGRDVCVCNTFTKRKYLKLYKDLAEECNAKFKVIRVNGDFGNIHNVPAETLKNMKEHFEDWEDEEIVTPTFQVSFQDS